MPTSQTRIPKTSIPLLAILALVVVIAPVALAADWVTFVDQTPSRLSAPSSVGSADVKEKDYAWGDVDKDGDIDLRDLGLILESLGKKVPVNDPRDPNGNLRVDIFDPLICAQRCTRKFCAVK